MSKPVQEIWRTWLCQRLPHEPGWSPIWGRRCTRCGCLLDYNNERLLPEKAKAKNKGESDE